MLEYSVWKPAINSDSASGRSNGTLLHSAIMLIIPNININALLNNHPISWSIQLRNNNGLMHIIELNDESSIDSQLQIAMVNKEVNKISKAMNWLIILIEPINEYWLNDEDAALNKANIDIMPNNNTIRNDHDA
jgi:hypothetical protein